MDDDLYAGRVRSGLRLVVDPSKDDSGEVIRDRSSEFSAEDHGKFSLVGAEIDDLGNHSDGWNQMRSPEFALGASLVEVDTKTPVEGQEAKIGGVLPSVETLVEGGELRETKSVTSSICFDATLSRSQNVLSLQKGCNPIGAYCGPWLQRLVGDDAHFTYRGVRYSVSHNLVGECLGIYCDKNSQKLMIFHGQKLIETHDLLKNFSGRVTKLEHRFYPLKRKVRSDGHVLFHGKLYSTGDSYLGRTVFISHDDDHVTIRDFDGKIVAVHDSIQEDFRRTSTLSDHFGPWKKALDHHSYYREMARKIGLEAEEFVVGVLNKKKGLIDASLIFRFFRLAKKHDRDIFLSLCREQVDKRDFRLKPLVAMLEWLDA